MLVPKVMKTLTMKNKNNMKNRLRTFQIILVLAFLLFLFILLMPKNYKKEYQKDNIAITETYNKKEDAYYFTFKINDIILDYLVESKYKQNRNLITNVTIIKDEENFCLIPTSEKFDTIPLCYEDEQIVHYSQVNSKLKDQLTKYIKPENKKIENYQDIEIYSKDYTYLLWNYDGFYFIDKDNKKKINIFDKELYNISLVGYTNDYLVIADYDSNYTFNNFYTIQFKKGTLKKQDLDFNLYFDSYFIGYEKNKIYLVDNKESVMYEFNAKNGTIDKIKSKVLNKDKWETTNIKTLINQKKEFQYISNYEYKLDNGTLYLNYTNKEIKKQIATSVTSIIRINDKDITYLKKDTLYHFNEITGEEKLLTYFEWNFNSKNMIFIN